MKNLLKIIITLTALYGLIWAFIVPDYIKANDYLQNACAINMASDKEIICD